MADADQELFASFLKETCESLYDLTYKVEDYLSPPPCDCCGQRTQQSEIVFKTRFALQIITGIDEEDAIDLVREIHYARYKKFNADKNTEEARKFLENNFNCGGENNEP